MFSRPLHRSSYTALLPCRHSLPALFGVIEVQGVSPQRKVKPRMCVIKSSPFTERETTTFFTITAEILVRSLANFHVVNMRTDT